MRWLLAVWRWVRPRHIRFWLAESGGPVGEWEVWPLPRQPGRYRYSCYRSAFHAHLHRELQAGRPVWIAYQHRGEEVRCLVVACPETWVLELAEVQTLPL